MNEQISGEEFKVSQILNIIGQYKFLLDAYRNDYSKFVSTFQDFINDVYHLSNMMEMKPQKKTRR